MKHAKVLHVGSDHHALTAIRSLLRLSLDCVYKAATPRRENYDWSVLKPNQDLQQILSTIDDKYQLFITANKEATKEMIPKKAKRKTMKYNDDERVKRARSRVYTAYSSYTTNHKDERQEEQKRTFKTLYTTIFGEKLNAD